MIFMAAAATATAEVLTPSQALERALGSAPAGMRKAAIQKGLKLQPALTVGATDAPEVYVVTPSAESLVIVSAESETPALLGYADAAFDPANIPPAMAAMLETYSHEIRAVRAGIATAATGGGRADLSPVHPLCKTTWDQDKPYNYYCPRLNGELCMTGCVATAMGQVLKALEWPAKCNGGKETYTWENGSQNLTLNFDDITFDWGVMKDNLTSTTSSALAVATLLRALGYAGHMNYSPIASGTYGISMAAGLVNHFDYDSSMTYELHDWYTQAEWESLIHAELAKGIPVYCDGVNSDYSMGHAFVIDGYAGDGFFHLNWGWSGLSDGYYRMTALDPVSQGIGGSTGGYNFAQGVLVGLKKGRTTPDSERPITMYCYNTFSVTSQTVDKGKAATFTGGFYNLSPFAINKATPGVKFVNETTGEEIFYKSASSISNELAPNFGINEYSVTMPSSIPEGTYTVYPTIYDRTSKITYDIRTRIGGYGYLTATVSGSSVTFSVPTRATIIPKNIKLSTPAYIGTPFIATATVTNSTAQPYNGFLTPALFRTNGSIVQAFEAKIIELEPRQSKEFSFTCNLSAGVAAGTYSFVLLGEDGYQAGPVSRITVSERPAEGVMTFKDLKVTNTAKNNLTFEVTATCTSGLYSGPIFVVIFRKSGAGNYLDYFMSEPVLINPDETTTVEIASTFAAGSPGTTYSAAAYYSDGVSGNTIAMENSKLVQFTLTDGKYGEADAIDQVSAAGADAEWFDLQGRRIAAPGRGLMIRRQGDKAVKVSL